MKPGLGMDAGSRTSMLWTLGDTIRTAFPQLAVPTSTSEDRTTRAFDPSEAIQRLVADRSFMCYGILMAKTIAQRQLRNDNAKVIEAVAAGESFVVTRNGVPVAELRPIQQTRRTFVPTAELLVLAATGPRINRKRFREDLDRVVDQGL
jgi:prevent-host-death family protein